MRKKKIGALLMSACMVTSLAACGGGDDVTPTPTPVPSTGGSEATPVPTDAAEPTQGSETTPEPTQEANDPTPTEAATAPTGDAVVIRYGTHWVNDLDPNYVDEVTGEYTMGESQRQAALAALAEVKSQLNVEFEFIQYSADTREELMTSVLAGNPVCDLALIWGGAEGTVLAQNVLQQLDDYAYIFEDEDTSWMFYDKLYGHNYLMSNVIRYKQRWPLIFNLTMIEKVDSLKDENGNTITPMDHYLNGTWTWSTFTDYLTKIQAYYANTAAPDGTTYDTIQAYETDHRFAGLSAMYAAGGAIYGNSGLEPDSAESIKGVQYVEELFEKKLLVDPGVYDDGYTPRWTTAADDFGKGATVFTDCPDWWIGGVATSASDRGEVVGIVPWPREDSLSIDDPEYSQAITLGDSVGVLKGVDPEKTELALKAYALYWVSYYKALGGVDSVAAYKEQNAIQELNSMNIDVLNEKYGEQIIECFLAIGDKLVNDYADLLGLRVTWDDIIGKSMYGIDGMSSYDVAVQANKNLFTNVTSNMESILASNEIHDNQAPSVDGSTAVFAAGTDPASVNWAEYFTANDSVDGELDMTKAEYKVSDGTDFTTPGSYGDAVEAKISDAAGNTGSKKIRVVIYNPDNTTAPTIAAKAELPSVKLDTDTSTISWKDFIDSATDVDGIDVSDTITADLSELDTTTPGTYNVALTVTDYAGNTGSATIEVTVAAE